MSLMDNIIGKNTIITSNMGGGSTSFALYLTDYLCKDQLILYYSTGQNIDINFVKNYYHNVYEYCIFIMSPLDIFFNYITNLGSKLENFSYIIIDTADIIGKDRLISIKSLLDIYNIKLIVTSQLRINPNSSKPYSTVEEWNKQVSGQIFHNSIWIRNVNEPNTIVKRKYIDIYKLFRRGNRYMHRYILNFDKRRGNIL